MATPQSAPPSSPGSTIDDPDISDDEQRQWNAKARLANSSADQDRTSPVEGSPPPTREAGQESSLDPTTTKSPRRTDKSPRKSKGATGKTSFGWVNEGLQDGNTEDEGSAMTGDDSKKSRWALKKSDSRRNSDVDVKRTSKTATTVGTRRQANGTIGKCTASVQSVLSHCSDLMSNSRDILPSSEGETNVEPLYRLLPCTSSNGHGQTV